MADVLETRYATPHLRQAAMQLLALGTARAPVTSDHLAAASGLLLEKLSRELADVIGPDGVRSILRRAVKLMPPEFAFNLVVGGPGSGKTTLAHQIMFANVTAQRRGLYFTIVGEPPLKMLRYQQQYRFFDPAKVNGMIRFSSLSGEIQLGLPAVLESIVRQVEAVSPGWVVVDSFRSVLRVNGREGAPEVQDFVQRLALHLTAWEA